MAAKSERYQLNVMQGDLPREVYMIPVYYFKKNKALKKLLYKYMDVDADVEENTWAAFHKEVFEKFDKNMDKEFKPYIFEDGETYTIKRILWIAYE